MVKAIADSLVKKFNESSNGYYNALGSEIYANLTLLAMLNHNENNLLIGSNLLATLNRCDFVLDSINDNVRLVLVYKETGQQTQILCGSPLSLKNPKPLAMSDNSRWWVKKASENEQMMLDAVKRYYDNTDINSILDDFKEIFSEGKNTFCKTISSAENIAKITKSHRIFPSAEVLEELILKKDDLDYFHFKKIFEKKEENNLSLEF